MDTNVVILSGRLGKDPEGRETNSGTVANFSIAVKETKGKTMWVDIAAWKKTAELVLQYLHSGDKVTVQGKLIEQSWDTNDGQKRTKKSVIAYQIEFHDKVNKNSDNGGQRETRQVQNTSSAASKDDETDWTKTEDDPWS